MRTASELERRVYNMLKRQYPGKVISPYTLRLESLIQNAKSVHQFQILEENGTSLKSEIKLNKNDVLFATALGYGLYQRNATNAASTSECVEPVQTYPNEVYFTTGGVFVPRHLEIFYNARLFLQVGSKVFVPGILTRDFKAVPQTQQSSAANKSQWDENVGFVELPTYYRLRGTDDIDLKVEIKPFTGMQIENDQANTENRLVLFIKGFVIKQGASLEPVKQRRAKA
jgi:hypothetical protein